MAIKTRYIDIKNMIYEMSEQNHFSIQERSLLTAAIIGAAQNEYDALADADFPNFSRHTFPKVYFYAKYGGKKTHGLRTVLEEMSKVIANLLDNYARVIAGAKISTSNLSMQNCKALAEQWSAAEKYYQYSKVYVKEVELFIEKVI